MVLTERTAGGLAGLLAIVGGVAAIAGARSFPPSITATDVGPSIFPTAYGALLALLGAVLFARSLRRAASPAGDGEAPPDLARLGLGILGAAAYAVAIGYAGFAIATIAYLWLMIALMRGAGGMRRPSTFVLAVLIGLAVYGVFVTVLQVPLPTGLWLESEA